MTLTNWKLVDKAVKYFKDFQDKYNYVEYYNAQTVKYQMRDVMEQLDDNELLKSLIKFYMYYPDGNDRSFAYFFKHYNEFLEVYINKRQDDKARRAMAVRTLQPRIDKKEDK